jgi:hypothetical protein
MKTHFGIWIITAFVLSSVSFLQGAPAVADQSGTAPQVPVPTPYAITRNDANSRVWEQTAYEQSASGQIVPKQHSYTELASGLNHLVNGQWAESSEQIDILSNGTAVATNGQHQAYFPGDIYQGQIKLVTPDGEQLYSRPVGLSYFDGTNSVLIAELTNSIGVVVGSNQVVYPNAFTDFKADLRYTYTKAGFEQDVILREAPLTPEAYGLNPATARLQMLTEFFNPPQPAIQSQELAPQAGLSLTDESLGFGAMQMVPGKAFLMGQTAQDAGARVNKQWLLLDGRQFLVEEVPVEAIADGLAKLPLTAMNSGSSKNARTASRQLILPPQRLAKNDTGKPMLLTKADLPTPGLVLDYQTVTGNLTNYTFQGDTTYYISGSVTLSRTNTFEGGTVIKYASGASLTLQSSQTIVNWAASAYRPVILTAKDDNTVGENISGSTGTPTNYYANPVLAMNGNATNISYFRIAYAQLAISASATTTISLKNGQIINCQNGIRAQVVTTVNLENLLFDHVQTDLSDLTYDNNIYVQNSTFNSSSNLTSTTGSYQTVMPYFTNCIFANINQLTNNPVNYGLTYGVAGANNGFYSSPVFGSSPVSSYSYPFQTVGAGSFYLATNSNFHNFGTTNIGPTLLASLKQKTTYPPLVLSNFTFAASTSLSPQVSRDTNSSPDLGYHYDPIDYIVDRLAVSNATLTIKSGTAIASYNEAGIQLQNGSAIVSIGTPLSPNWFVRYQSVQEQSVSLGGTNTFSGITVSSATNGNVTASFLFSKFACPAGGGYYLFDVSTTTYTNLSVQSCEFWGGNNDFSGTNAASVATLNNNLFWRSTMYASNTSSLASLFLTNNLFWGTSVTLSQPSSGLWSAFNNDFDTCTITNSTLTNGYNAYLNCTGRLYPTNAYDIVSTNTLDYQSSWLGGFYQPTNSLLINAGSTTADQVSLYHFTTQTNQVKETNSIVDIGYHYVALNGSGNPIDSNSDGIPDYLEDANGNGIADGTETNWGIAILAQPASQTVVQGTNVTFSVTAAGTAPLTYQWWFNGTNLIAGATNTLLTLTNVQASNVGSYFAVVTNMSGSVTSVVATLALTCDTSPTGLVFWWPGDGDANDYASTNNGTLVGGATYVSGKVWQAFSFNGTSDLVSTALQQNNPQNFTLELWFKTTTTNGGVLIGFGNSQTGNSSSYDRHFYMDNSGKLHIGMYNGGAKMVDSVASYNDGSWHHAAATVSLSSGSCLYVDGTLVASNLTAITTANYNGWWRIGQNNISGWPSTPSSYYFQGAIDEVSIYSRPLTATEIQAIYNAGSAGKCLPPWPVPATPTNLVATAISSNQISLTWNEAFTNGVAMQISIERSTASNGTYAVIGTVANTLSYIDTDLVAGTTYYYRVRAINNSTTWSDYSNVAWAITTANGASLPLASLQLWLRADAGLVQGNTNTPVRLWPDQSGHANNATQVIGAYQPLWVAGALNGLPVVRFNGTNSYFNLPNLMSNASAGEVFVALKSSTTNAQHSLWRMGVDSSYEGFYPNSDRTLSEDFGTTQVKLEGTPSQALDQFHVYEMMSQANNWGSWIDGVLLYQTTVNTVGFATAPTLGFSTYQALSRYGYFAQDSYFYGDIAEVLVFNRALTTAERLTVNLYLNGKYGLVATVPLTPTNLVAMAISTNQIGLTWNEVLTNGGATQISIEQSTTSNGIYTAVAQVANVLSYVDTNLAAGMTYYYRVRAANLTVWSDYSSVAYATTLTNKVSLPLQSLALWLRADAGLVQGVTNIPVNIWADQSGNGNNATPTALTSEPSWVPGVLNGMPVVRFNGSNSFFNLPNFMNGAAAGESFVVLKSMTTNAQHSLWRMGVDSSYEGFYPYSDGTLSEDFGTLRVQRQGTPPQAINQYHIYEVMAQNNNWASWINGSLFFQSAGNIVAFGTAATLGFSTYQALSQYGYFAQDSYFYGDIAEVLIFNRALTVDEKITVGDYLTTKYNLSLPPASLSCPSAPTNLIAKGISSYQLNLIWARTSTNETGFVIERKLGTNGVYQEIGTSAGVTNFVDATAIPTNQYVYRVKAVNYFGQSVNSSEISPPVVGLTLLSTNAYATTGSTNILLAQAASAYSSISQIQIVNDLNTRAVIGMGTSVPYTNLWVAAFPVTYSLTALATDALGNSRYSAPLNITVSLDYNGDGIPDYLQVLQGINPLNPWLPPAANTNDHTAPVIMLLIPTNAVIVP